MARSKTNLDYSRTIKAANLAYKESGSVSKKTLVTDSTESKGLVSKKNNSEKISEKINGPLTQLHFAILSNNEKLKNNIETGEA
tara:strand:+ start:17 stop:268 length:252 start_codon:yes stop_codon:yes gene_type:complete